MTVDRPEWTTLTNLRGWRRCRRGRSRASSSMPSKRSRMSPAAINGQKIQKSMFKRSRNRRRPLPRGTLRGATRWSTTIPPKVNLPHAIDCRALSGANLVTNFDSTEPAYSTVRGGEGLRVKLDDCMFAAQAGPYGRIMPMALGGGYGGWRFLMNEVALYRAHACPRPNTNAPRPCIGHGTTCWSYDLGTTTSQNCEAISRRARI